MRFTVSKEGEFLPTAQIEDVDYLISQLTSDSADEESSDETSGSECTSSEDSDSEESSDS